MRRSAVAAVRRGGVVCGLLALAACTAADNLSYAELVGELDAIVRLPSAPGDRLVRYRDRAAVSPWYMRSPLTWPMRWPLGAMFGATAEADLTNPVGHVRELLGELPDEVGADLGVVSDAFVRLLLLAELDAGVGVRIEALRGLARLVEPAGLAPFAEPGQAFQGPLAADAMAAALAAVRLLGEGEPESAATPAVRAALAAAGDRPMPTSRDRLQWVHDLGAVWRDRSRRALRPLVGPCLQKALTRAYEALLLELVGQRESALVELRLCALQQLRSCGGPQCVPWLLAHLTAVGGDLVRGESAADSEPWVPLRLIHLCGQLSGGLALQAVRLPGRPAAESLSPADYLAQVACRPDSPPALRTPALAALSLCLGRERLEFDAEWVRAWQVEQLKRP